jgi:hypothetical protein
VGGDFCPQPQLPAGRAGANCNPRESGRTKRDLYRHIILRLLRGARQYVSGMCGTLMDPDFGRDAYYSGMRSAGEAGAVTPLSDRLPDVRSLNSVAVSL